MLKGFYNISTLDFLEYCNLDDAYYNFYRFKQVKRRPDIKSFNNNNLEIKKHFSYLAKLFQQVRRIISSGNFMVLTDGNYVNYISIILKEIFGVENFRNQIQLSIFILNTKNSTIILHFSKSKNFINNSITRELTEQEIRRFNNKDEKEYTI